MSRDCLVLLFCHGLIKTCKQKYIHGFYIDLFLNRWSEAVLLSCNHASHSAMGGGEWRKRLCRRSSCRPGLCVKREAGFESKCCATHLVDALGCLERVYLSVSHSDDQVIVVLACVCNMCSGSYVCADWRVGHFEM